MKVSVDVAFLGEDKFQIDSAGTKTTNFSDMPKQDSTSAGPNPLELCLASLGACMSHFARNYLSRQSIEHSTLKMYLSASLSDDSPHRLVDIKAVVKTDARLGDKEEAFLSFVDKCIVHNTFKSAPDVALSLAK